MHIVYQSQTIKFIASQLITLASIYRKSFLILQYIRFRRMHNKLQKIWWFHSKFWCTVKRLSWTIQILLEPLLTPLIVSSNVPAYKSLDPISLRRIQKCAFQCGLCHTAFLPWTLILSLVIWYYFSGFFFFEIMTKSLIPQNNKEGFTYNSIW